MPESTDAALVYPFQHARLHAAEAETPIDEVALCLQNASRWNPHGSYRRRLTQLMQDSLVLDYLERCVFEERAKRHG